MPRSDVIDLNSAEEAERLSKSYDNTKKNASKASPPDTEEDEEKQLSAEQMDLCTSTFRDFVINYDEWPVKKFVQFFKQTRLQEEGVTLPEAVVLCWILTWRLYLEALAIP